MEHLKKILIKGNCGRLHRILQAAGLFSGERDRVSFHAIRDGRVKISGVVYDDYLNEVCFAEFGPVIIELDNITVIRLYPCVLGYDEFGADEELFREAFEGSPIFV